LVPEIARQPGTFAARSRFSLPPVRLGRRTRSVEEFMPRYHVEFTRPDGVVLFDEIGADFTDLAAAKAHIRSVIGTVHRTTAQDLDWAEWIATIREPGRDEVAVIRFTDVTGLRVA
jgi:hypothetical protein